MATPASQLDAAAVEAQLLEIVRELLREQGKARAAEKVSLQASLQKDLGLASLDLVELLVRCESLLEVELPDEVAEQADTPAGWVHAILQGGQETAAHSVYRIVPPARPARVPHQARTLVDVLRFHAEADPGRIHIHLFEDGAGQGITHGSLYETAAGVARGLIARGLLRGDTAAVMLPNTVDFFCAVFGIMLAGGVPVPVYPPASPDRIGEYVRGQLKILRNAGIRFLISFPQMKPVSRLLRVNLPRLLDVATVAELAGTGGPASGPLAVPADIALIQYTSGSTGDPKGVVLTHDMVLENLRAIATALRVTPEDAVVSWLPLASDMGMVGCWLFSLYHGAPLTQLSPLDFLRRPESWLWAIADSRGTLSAAPNFAYEHCTRRIPAWTLEGVDLGCWRVAVNAGESVLPETVKRFSERFAPYGFRAESVLPSYGLAEAGVALAIPPPGRRPVMDTVRRRSFESAGRAEPAGPQESDVLRFFFVGAPLEGQEIRIADHAGRGLPERSQGRLLFRGRMQTSGYYRNDEATAAVRLPDGWMDTGDLAYTAGGEVFITGRAKDVILKAGRAFVPADIEAAAGELPGVARGAVAAIGVADSETGTERLVVIAESPASTDFDLRRIEREILGMTSDLLGAPADSVLIIPPGTLPKTANGKLRRARTAELYRRGLLGRRAGPLWWQIAGLWCRNLPALAALGARKAARGFRRAAVAAITAGVACAAGIAIRTGARGWLAAAARVLLALAGKSVVVRGECLLNRRGPAVVVANRSGALDPVALCSVLAGPIRFAGCDALRGLPGWARFLLRPSLLATHRGIPPDPGGWARVALRQALERGEVVVLLSDGPAGAPVERSRFRLDALHGARETRALLVPLATREVPHPGRPGRMQTELVAAPSWQPQPSDDPFELRERLRAAILEAHA